MSQRYARVNLRSGNIEDGLVNPGMVLQWAYYRQLSTKDYYFSNIFRSMALQWEKVDSPSSDFGKHYGQLYQQASLP